MAWSYRKRIKVIPGIYLNLSKSGISTSIGVKGASMTFGKPGTYLNTCLPSLGVYNRHKLSGSGLKYIPQPHNPIEVFNNSENIFSADIHQITSQNMQGIKEAILLAQQQREELKNDLLKIQSALKVTKVKRTLSYVFLYGLLNKAIPTDLQTNIEAQKEAIRQTRIQIDNSCVKLSIAFEPEIRDKYFKLIEVFKKLSSCQKIWDVTSAHYQDRVAARSSASTVVNKKIVSFAFKSLPDIKSDVEAIYFQNANGADLYFYPSFIIMYSNPTKFAIVGFNEIKFQHNYVRFTETGPVPIDTKIIDRTWAKVNKNGTPDRRFKGNYQIPVVRYGMIRLRSNTGINEEYEFSNYELTEQFGKAFKEYQAALKLMHNI